MLDTSRQRTKNFLIVSASLSEIIDTKISKLSFLARQAYYSRDYNRMAIAGNELINLSSRCEDLGRYFYAIAEHQSGQTKFNKKVFEDLANRSSLPIRAAAILALGLWELESGKTDDAVKLFQESYDLSITNNRAPITAIHTITSASQVLSMIGSHSESLAMLRMIQPAVREWGQLFPLLLGEQYNNTAFELFKLGELEAAHYAINKALQLPIARAYPEWFETKIAIEEKLEIPQTPAMISIPVSYENDSTARQHPEPIKKPEIDPGQDHKVLAFKRKKIQIWLKYKNYTHFLQWFSFEDEWAVKRFLIFLLDGIDELRQGESTATLTICTQLLENHEIRYETENFITESNFDKLFKHFEYLNLMLEILGEKESLVDTQLLNEHTEKILQLIEADEAELPIR